jgi:hypothetical protein
MNVGDDNTVAFKDICLVDTDSFGARFNSRLF